MHISEAPSGSMRGTRIEQGRIISAAVLHMDICYSYGAALSTPSLLSLYMNDQAMDVEL
jgi:hypothetical protein